MAQASAEGDGATDGGAETAAEAAAGAPLDAAGEAEAPTLVQAAARTAMRASAREWDVRTGSPQAAGTRESVQAASAIVLPDRWGFPAQMADAEWVERGGPDEPGRA